MEAHQRKMDLQQICRIVIIALSKICVATYPSRNSSKLTCTYWPI
jgi:S-adenosylmethionine/arginine decarboxylase-like enzyme